jgi:hypothetical protein
MVRIWFCCSLGNWSMIRSTVEAAVVVWRVGLQVAHLSDQDDVRVLAQRGAQRALEALGVGADLPLVDQALLVVVDELDRVFDGDDVIGPVAVDVVDHRAEGRRLARARGPRHQHQALGQVTEGQDLLAQPQLLGGEDLAGDDPEHAPDALPIAEQVGPVASQPLQLVGEVGVVLLGELLAVLGRRDLLEHALQVARAERAVSLEARLEAAVEAHHGDLVGAQVQVGGPGLGQNAEVLVDGGHG